MPELVLERGLVFTHDATREGKTQRAPLLSGRLHEQWRGGIGSSCSPDETDRKGKRRGTALYRAIDREGNLADGLLSERRDEAAAEAFFRAARARKGSRNA